MNYASFSNQKGNVSDVPQGGGAEDPLGGWVSSFTTGGGDDTRRGAGGPWRLIPL